jgi:hypothetical protein
MVLLDYMASDQDAVKAVKKGHLVLAYAKGHKSLSKAILLLVRNMVWLRRPLKWSESVREEVSGLNKV